MALLGRASSQLLARYRRAYISPQGQHDAIDLTDKSVTTLANFPLIRRLRALHLANNHVMSISPSLHLSLPNLTIDILASNSLATRRPKTLERLQDLR